MNTNQTPKLATSENLEYYNNLLSKVLGNQIQEIFAVLDELHQRICNLEDANQLPQISYDIQLPPENNEYEIKIPILNYNYD